jgi:hypothetical protein
MGGRAARSAKWLGGGTSCTAAPAGLACSPMEEMAWGAHTVKNLRTVRTSMEKMMSWDSGSEHRLEIKKRALQHEKKLATDKDGSCGDAKKIRGRQ